MPPHIVIVINPGGSIEVFSNVEQEVIVMDISVDKQNHDRMINLLTHPDLGINALKKIHPL